MDCQAIIVKIIYFDTIFISHIRSHSLKWRRSKGRSRRVSRAKSMPHSSPQPCGRKSEKTIISLSDKPVITLHVEDA
jgi:hypothetical protein